MKENLVEKVANLVVIKEKNKVLPRSMTNSETDLKRIKPKKERIFNIESHINMTN